MFEWLDDEMRKIKTGKFHLVDGPASPELRQAINASDCPLPPSYREFVLRFGNAELYRYSSNYYITVYAGPREEESSAGEAFVNIGRTWTSHVYFKEELLASGEESPVFEWFDNGIRRTADGFEQWLIDRSKAARTRYTIMEWEAIEKGPPPFNEYEQAIVDARNRFRWRVIGVAPNEDLCFEVHNGSTMTLPYLSVGIRGKSRPPKNGQLNGGAFLPVASIGPGETEVVESNCYKKYIVPAETEAFALPDPGPEDREQYWEFRT